VGAVVVAGCAIAMPAASEAAAATQNLVFIVRSLKVPTTL
jgi:hypothetical protein